MSLIGPFRMIQVSLSRFHVYLMSLWKTLKRFKRPLKCKNGSVRRLQMYLMGFKRPREPRGSIGPLRKFLIYVRRL